MTTNRILLRAALACAALPLSACTLAADLDRFERAGLCSVELALTEFHFHAPMGGERGHVMTIRLVKPPDAPGGTPGLRALAILDATPGPDFDVSLPNAVLASDGPFDVHFFADVDRNGAFTPTVGGAAGEDHSWILDDVCGAPRVAFEHDTVFETFDDPQTNTTDLAIAFANMPVTDGALEVQLRQLAGDDPEGEDRTVGLYRLDAVVAPAFELTLPRIVDPDGTVAYEVRIWADADGDGSYDLGVDDSWIVLADGATLVTPLSFDYELRDGNREDIERLLVTVAAP